VKVTIAAGGTGGHVFPAVAVASALLRRGDSVHWIGRPNSLEESEAKDLGAGFSSIPLQGIKRKWTLENLRALARFAKGRRMARKALKEFDPDVVFALGSYVGAPVMSAAFSLGVPVLVHEQNVVPGLVVRHYAGKVARLLLTQPLEDRKLKARAEVVGMPLRPGIVLDRQDAFYADLGLDPTKKTLFLFGGSQGAIVFCTVALELAKKWKEQRPDWQILLQTGVANLKWAQSRLSTGNVVLVAHLHAMGKAYACADVVVSRSGAASCAELAAVGKPAVLVPYPYATADHQRKNAEAYIRQYPSRLIPQDRLSLESLEEALSELETVPPHPQDAESVSRPVEEILRVMDEVVLGGGEYGRHHE
jgi:UDP-N-acetylglucosamine--N-acetylmuramyl-(pentapeptide) pyrophosphoryl-undecaprenol N-acetylglucosamine transferase